MCENHFCTVIRAIDDNIRNHMDNYQQWRNERFGALKDLADIADIELDRRKQRKRRRLEGW